MYLDAGNRNEHGLCFGARRMAELLRARGVALEFEEFDGGHRGTGYRFEELVALGCFLYAAPRAAAERVAKAPA